MQQIKCHQVSLGDETQPLLDQVSFIVNKRERIAIIGRNGVGKSTLLKLLEGQIIPDSGSIERSTGLKIISMAQDVPDDLSGKLIDYLTQVHQSQQSWESYQVDCILDQLKLDPELLLEGASGGQIRRVLLAAALVNDPDVLLLDEPTNHLDIDAITWLEGFLLSCQKTLIFITHDREFMQKIATRIIEIDLGGITSWSGDYRSFLKNKAAALVAEAHQQKVFDKKLSQEEVWIRQGIKARRTRNEGRVRALEKLRQQYSQRRTRQGTVNIAQQDTSYAGKLTFQLSDITIGHGDKILVKDFSTTILRGDKVAILGPNGCGKSSLLKVMLGEDLPKKGEIKRGTQQDVVYFDQHRSQLDLNATALDNVGEGSQEIVIGQQKKHVISYLQEFLFTPDKSRSLVKTFSGGERNRLLLAKMLAKPSNVLVMDEPTNDLDMETLDILEAFLIDYPGTLILVSHDRALINYVATQTIAFEGQGVLQEYVGGYDDWLRQRISATEEKAATKPPRKLSYAEQKELGRLPKQIEKLETKIQQISEAMAQPGFYEQPQQQVDEKTKTLSEQKDTLQKLYQRWEHLEEKP